MTTCPSIGLRTLTFVTVIFMFLATIALYDKGAYKSGSTHIHTAEDGSNGTEIGMELYPSSSGSRLPDCSHACGPCFPCKRVTVSFKCSVAESCPVVYKCMCKGKYYHVPSN